jgi:hypothetical protein
LTYIQQRLLYEHPTVCKLCNALEHEPTESENNFISDAVLAADIKPGHPFSVRSFQQNKVLLTGATGFLGAYFVRELIQTNPHIQIYCLVRARDERHALKRIQVSMDKYQLWELYENMPKYDSSNTQNALGPLRIHFPEINTSLMKRYFNYMKNVGYLEKC